MGPDAPEKRNAGVCHPVLSRALTPESLFYDPSSCFSSSVPQIPTSDPPNTVTFLILYCMHPKVP